MHASKQLAHRISQRLKDLRNNNSDPSRVAFPEIVSDTLAYREVVSSRVGFTSLLSDTEIVEILQYTVRWLDLQDDNDNELIIRLPELIEFSISQVVQRTSGRIKSFPDVGRISILLNAFCHRKPRRAQCCLFLFRANLI